MPNYLTPCCFGTEREAPLTAVECDIFTSGEPKIVFCWSLSTFKKISERQCILAKEREELEKKKEAQETAKQEEQQAAKQNIKTLIL